MNRHLLAMLFGCATSLVAASADAGSSYDGSWNIIFVTQSGDCNPTYNYAVNIENGVITSPNLATFSGNVTISGAVRASVSVQEKHASGSGKLGRASGRGMDGLFGRPAVRGILDSPAILVDTNRRRGCSGLQSDRLTLAARGESSENAKRS
jgi:hypothetical protein